MRLACSGPVDDRFTGLTASAGVTSATLGNVTANDCPSETIITAGGGLDFFNITIVFLALDAGFQVRCTSAGPFSGSFYYDVPSGRGNVFISGTCL